MPDEADVVIVPYRDGPYLVRGPVVVRDQDGNEVTLARSPVALCRCGRSQMRPFCDGTHQLIRFQAPSQPERPFPVAPVSAHDRTHDSTPAPDGLPPELDAAPVAQESLGRAARILAADSALCGGQGAEAVVRSARQCVLGAASLAADGAGANPTAAAALVRIALDALLHAATDAEHDAYLRAAVGELRDAARTLDRSR